MIGHARPAARARRRAEGADAAEPARQAFDVVIPTLGRASLARVLETLRAQRADVPGEIVVVDDRRDRRAPLPGIDDDGAIRTIAGPAVGPAAARNAGWRSTSAEWVAFLDDDVEPGPDWARALAADLGALPRIVAASQGRIRVPLPRDRRPTDWERNVAGLETARWATADIAYRRHALEAVGGFDERFPRAYREDADLGLRVIGAGFAIATGARETVHPVRRADRFVSLRLQAGNADDALMRAIHGPSWGRAAGVPPGRRPLHLAIACAGALALVGLATRRRRVASVAGAAWLAGTVELAVARITPGPWTAAEIATMAGTSVLMPFAAAYQWIRGAIRARALTRERAVTRERALTRERAVTRERALPRRAVT